MLRLSRSIRRVAGVWFPVLAALGGAALHAAVGVSTAAGQEVPFVGIVVEDDVKARAGQGREYYVVGDVPKGSLVEVHEVVYGWYKIVPPPNVHSYVSKGFVRARGDGTTGVVTGDNAWVRAAGVDRAPHLSYQKQLLLADGQTVGIVGERDDFYLIAPPRGAYVFVPPTALRRATPDEIAAARASQDAAAPAAVPPADTPPAAPTPSPEAPPAVAMPQAPAAALEPAHGVDEVVVEPAAEPAEEFVPQPMGEPQPQVETPSVEAQPQEAAEPQASQESQQAESAASAEPEQWPTVISDRMKAAETAYREVFDQPLEEQPIDSLRAGYEAVTADVSLPHSDRQIAAARIQQINRNAQLVEALRQLGQSRGQLGQRSVDDVMAEWRRRQAEAEANRPPYDAVGRLLASAVYDGGSLPRLYRLVDPATGRTIAYVDPSAWPQAAEHLGSVVGVRGAARFDPGLKLRLFTVERIEQLSAASE